MKKVILLLNLAIAMLLIASGISWAANTPWWWNNPYAYARFHQTASTGVIENNTVIAPGQAQLVTVQYDVPNEFNQSLTKLLWVQMEWTVANGTGELVLSGSGAPSARWMNVPGSCPESPRLPYPDPPSGQGLLVDETGFAPVHGYAVGNEFSINITPQPACERLYFNFVLDPDTRIEYRIEVQTACLEYDWADAPDDAQNSNDYPTRSASNGARHVLSPGIHFGALADYEADGQPTANADGDDLNSSDDEDALAAPVMLTVGVPPAITLPVVAPSGQNFTVNGWIDLNADGDWNDPGEFATISGTGTGASSDVTLNFPVGAASPATLTFARFRLSSNAAEIATPSGLAYDGEVEDYPVTIEQRPPDLDFGDVPTNGYSYPVMLEQDGARHVIIPDFHLGAKVDMDTNGQATGDADGDDLDIDGDDEDALTGPITLTVGVIPSITLPVVAPAGQPFSVSGWIDLNDDGDWSDANEFAQTAGVGIGGPVNITLNFPAAPANTTERTYARFRLCTDASYINTPAGQAPNGEVEDYTVTIEPALPDFDFGDAPDPGYPSLLSSNGARHVILPGLQMGLALDADVDSPQMAGNAGGDDLDDGNDDEDGIDASQLIFTENQTRSIIVNVNTPSEMTVYAIGWVDYNGDQVWQNSESASGSWTGFGAGAISLNFPIVPIGSATATSGHSYARFRISTDEAAIANPTGAAPDGEVEDYPVDILVPVELTSFTANFVSNTVRLDWVTQSESENLGYHVYRATSPDGNYTRINSAMITGAGTSPQVHYYFYVDQTIQPGVAYYYKLADVNYNGVMTMHGPLTVQTAPQNYGLEQNYPNPFNPETRINFKMVRAGTVELGVYNLRGQLVRSLVSGTQSAGEHSVIWDGRNDSGQVMPSGTYLYKVRANGYEETKKMEFLK